MNHKMINDKNMKTSAHFFARRFALALLALLTTATAWAQLAGAGTEDNPLLIQSSEDWIIFAQNVNGGINTNAYYKLTADITLGSPEKPIDIIVGTDEKNFRGVFDGDFHTIHINMKRKENYAALFGVTNNAKIKNLHVDGNIVTDHKFAGAFVAYAKNGDKKSTDLTNCISSVHITCDSIVTIDNAKPFDCTHGGLVGQNESGVTNFENCIFDGWIKDGKAVKTANKCTGFIGWVNNRVTYTNCIMAGVIEVKENDANLPNSMANFHRLAKYAKADFIGTSYYIHDYTYSEMEIQGVAALTETTENTISKKYVFEDESFYVPGANITEDLVTYYGWTLTKGTDYEVNKTGGSEPKMIYDGINNYAGRYVKNIPPVFQMNVTAWDADKKYGWYAISSPVNNQKFEDVTHLTTATHNIFRYDEEDRMWQEYRNAANLFDEFENGRGYIYRTADNGGFIGYNGSENTGDIKCKINYTERNDNLSGINLVGNPYNHAIYKSTAMDDEALAPGYCILNENGTWSYKSDDEAIPVGTAFLVQTKAAGKGEYTITMRDTDAAPSTKGIKNDIWFTVDCGDFSDVAHVEFTQGKNFSKMSHYNEDAPMLYIKHDGADYASLDMSENNSSIDLCFKAMMMGKYTLSFNVNGTYSYLHLIDRMTGADVDMLIEEEYSFIGSDYDNEERFIVKFTNDASAGVNETFAWQSGSDIIVNGNGELIVFDVTGKMLMNMFVNGTETINVPTKGVCILRMVGDEVKTQKIVIK